jgi:hypothetical protein
MVWLGELGIAMLGCCSVCWADSTLCLCWLREWTWCPFDATGRVGRGRSLPQGLRSFAFGEGDVVGSTLGFARRINPRATFTKPPFGGYLSQDRGQLPSHVQKNGSTASGRDTWHVGVGFACTLSCFRWLVFVPLVSSS